MASPAWPLTSRDRYANDGNANMQVKVLKETWTRNWSLTVFLTDIPHRNGTVHVDKISGPTLFHWISSVLIPKILTQELEQYKHIINGPNRGHPSPSKQCRIPSIAFLLFSFKVYFSTSTCKLAWLYVAPPAEALKRAQRKRQGPDNCSVPLCVILHISAFIMASHAVLEAPPLLHCD